MFPTFWIEKAKATQVEKEFLPQSTFLIVRDMKIINTHGGASSREIAVKIKSTPP